MNTNKIIKAQINPNTIELSEAIKSSFEKCNNASVEESGFYAFDFNSLIDLLVTRYHNHLEDQAMIIYDLSNSLLRKDGYLYPNLSKLVEHLFIFFHDLVHQFKKEEQFLFPNIIALSEKRLHEGSFDYSTYVMVLDYAAEMKKQHQSMLNNLQVLRELTGDFRIIEGDCRSYVTLMNKMNAFEVELSEHIHLESGVLIPKVTVLKQGE